MLCLMITLSFIPFLTLRSLLTPLVNPLLSCRCPSCRCLGRRRCLLVQ